MMPELNRIYQGDARAVLETWPDAFVNTCVTSPPYWGLRDYGVEGQIGLEKTPEEYIAKMVDIFREVRRILRNDGTLWINIGDSYASGGRFGHGNKVGYKQASNRGSSGSDDPMRRKDPSWLKPKDLVGIPWMLAFTMRLDGWFLRQDIIWSKPNPMPESMTDRCTKSHEYIFLMAKSERYYFDQEAIKEPAIFQPDHTVPANWAKEGSDHSAVSYSRRMYKGALKGSFNGKTGDRAFRAIQPMRNKRSVWTISTNPFPEAHFATFPPDLIAPCVLAGSPQNGIVLDPFMGAGTTALVAAKYSRQFLGIELNPEYIRIAENRIASELAQGKML